jgi:hypothetical protein
MKYLHMPSLITPVPLLPHVTSARSCDRATAYCDELVTLFLTTPPVRLATQVAEVLHGVITLEVCRVCRQRAVRDLYVSIYKVFSFIDWSNACVFLDGP